VLSGIGGSWQRAPHAPLASLGALATSNPVTSVDVQISEMVKIQEKEYGKKKQILAS